jgi:hypothetical protein
VLLEFELPFVVVEKTRVKGIEVRIRGKYVGY